MRLSTTEVRDVSTAGERVRGAGASYRDCIGEQTSGRGCRGRGRSNHITPVLTPAPRHTRHLSVRRYGDGPGRA